MAIAHWTDPRQATGAQLIITIMVCLGGTALMMYALMAIYREDFGDQVTRKLEIFGLYGIGLLLGFYACTGLYQMLFIERLNKFIVCQVEFGTHQFAVKGYFAKIDYFQRSDILSMEAYVVKRSRKSIMTLLDWRNGCYLMTLKDGRQFYISKNIDKATDLITSIASATQ